MREKPYSLWADTETLDWSLIVQLMLGGVGLLGHGDDRVSFQTGRNASIACARERLKISVKSEKKKRLCMKNREEEKPDNDLHF